MKKNLSYRLGIALLFLLFSYQQTTRAQDEASGSDIRGLGSGGIRSLSEEMLNPATISFREKGEISIFSFNRFGIKELSTSGIRGIFPNKRLNIGCKFLSYGYEDYRLTQGEISVAKNITPSLSLGIQFGCLHENSILQAQNKMYYFADPGIYWKVHSKFKWAFVSKNLLSTFNNSKPAFYMGTLYKPVPEFQIHVESGLRLPGNSHFSFGILYEILSQLSVRCGFRTDTSNPSIGASWELGRWRIDTVFLLHNSLDLSSGIGVCYSL